MANNTTPAPARAHSDQYLKCLSPRCPTYHPAATPHGAHVGDMFAAQTVKSGGVIGRAGDSLIFILTDDIQSGDVIAAYSRGRVSVGVLSFDEGRIVLCDSRGEPVDYYFKTAEVVGRVVEVQRAGRRIPSGIPLRPIHP